MSDVFPGSSEMATRMRAFDWAASALGEPADWPETMRAAVRICLTSRFPMILWWGPELRFLYNDAYLPLLGSKHPALDKPGRQVWSEIWHIIGPMLDSVLATGEATWSDDLLLPMNRHGYWEETYWTYSYSPLLDEAGAVVGVFTAVADTTARVVGGRRMAALQDLSAQAGGTTVAEACDRIQGWAARHGADVPHVQIALGRTGDDRWPLAQVIRDGEPLVVGDVTGLPTGGWATPPTEAMVLPLRNDAGDEPLGAVVLAASGGRALDEDYQAFLRLVADQIAALVNGAMAYQAQQRRAEELAELDRSKTVFFSNISHEFRTPLTLIAGPLRELRETAPPAVDEQLSMIERNAMRLGKLVNALLDFSRIEAGRVQARYEPVDLGALTTELASVFRAAMEKAGLDLRVDCGTLDRPVHVDREMWEKVVLNLLSNAFKFTLAGSVTVTLRADGDHAVLCVRDTGVGIPEPEMARLFERFHRIEQPRARSTEGSGIGLALVRELVRLHGGSIEAESVADEGTCFTVRIPFGDGHLPAAKVAPSAEAATPYLEEALRWLPPDVPSGGPFDQGPGYVLVADDNADMRDYLARLLGARHTVQTVGDGARALDLVRSDPPDLLISDVMMPGLDGISLVRELRSDPRTARLPVLLLSARAGQEAAAEGLRAGADDYLVKPFAAGELLARVNTHVRLGRVRRQGEERFRTMADVAPALIWASDRDGRRVLTNRGWHEFTGQDGLGEQWQAALHTDDRDRYLGTLRRATETGEPFDIEYRLRRADGAYHWVLEHAVPIGSGEEFNGHVASCVDVNERYREAERQRLLAQVGLALDAEPGVRHRMERLTALLIDARLADTCTVSHITDAGLPAVLASAGAPEIPPTVASIDEPTLVDGGMMVLPLRARGELLGVLSMHRSADGPPYQENDLLTAAKIADRAGVALDNALLLAEEQATARRLALLQEATSDFSAATTPHRVAETAVAHGKRLLLDHEYAVFEQRDPQRLEPLAVRGQRHGRNRVDLSEPSPVAEAIACRSPIWLDRLADLRDSYPGFIDEAMSAGFRSGAVIPLLANGKCIGVLALASRREFPLTDGDKRAALALAEQCAQALDRARLYQAEHEIAETLQRSLLPARLPVLDRLALAARYLAGAAFSQAGGDWYDVLPLDDDRVALIVGDVVGQGPRAAAAMGQLRSTLAAYLLEGHPPASALARLDEFAARIPDALASTVVCVVVDCAAAELRWARAGHLPPLVIMDGRTEFLSGARGPVLGLGTGMKFTEERCSLSPRAGIVLYTDGLVERRDADLDADLARLAETATDLPPEDLAVWLVDHLLTDEGPSDDVALVVARLMPEPLLRTLPARPDQLAVSRADIAEWARRIGLPGPLTEDLLLISGEATANAIEHAYRDRPPGEFSYDLRCTPDGGIAGVVSDNGCWRPPPADNGSRGRGLSMIRAASTRSDVHGSAAGTRVEFTLPPAVAGPGGAGYGRVHGR
ncbi:SpoIIE family protein phosphatase [Kutzneria buriramensis]|uniref:histidine kinase n=1 Tax=Kutzneria buriramensis TaxID=1045776 RepID=A0A3E0H7B0_9PSEU|nr:SpoIIE family protein phosphatase [Kutzneria buriramensis]REH39325.1 PAS domain S-box-containing protein [Kutzneria buriramensis]